MASRSMGRQNGSRERRALVQAIAGKPRWTNLRVNVEAHSKTGAVEKARATLDGYKIHPYQIRVTEIGSTVYAVDLRVSRG